MNRPALLSLPVRRLAYAAPAAAGLALAAAVIPAGLASAATSGCTTSGSQVTCVFTAAGAAQSWIVPAGVTSAGFTLYGAEGGASQNAGGLGAEVTATLSLTPGTMLQVNVGQAGQAPQFGENSTPGGFGGGGSGAYQGGGGGGASDIRGPAADGSYPLANRLLVAGGGGGAGYGGNSSGGGGGGNADSAGIAGVSYSDAHYNVTVGGGGGGAAGTTAGPGPGGAGGSGATFGGCASAGSAGTSGGTAASQGTGGDGGDASNYAGGGGGGGGYFGGGGGGSGAGDQCAPLSTAAGAGGGGGGGGASYPSTASITDGVAAPDDAPDGEVIITYTLPANTVTVTSPGTQAGTAGTAVSLPIQASDSAAGQALSYSATGLPAGLSINSGSGLISGTPTTAGSSTVTVTATDATGASGSASFSWTVNPAAVPTSTAVASSANPSAPGQPVTFTATVSPASGSATPAGTVQFWVDGAPSGSPVQLTASGTAAITISSLTPGSHAITAIYTSDTAGFTGSTGAVTQAVHYAFTGFAAPVDNPPAVNVVTAGRAIPIQFSLGGNFGLGILAAGYPTAVQVSCATGVPVNTGTETDTAGASGLQYNATGTYTYVWKTSKAAKGTCQVFTLGLTDGTVHTATFQYAN